MLSTTIRKPVTRANVDSYLDAGELYVQMRSRRWWRIRRNGATRRWKTDPLRIKVPYKYGMYGYDSITEYDFSGAEQSAVDPSHIRHIEDVPAELRA